MSFVNRLEEWLSPSALLIALASAFIVKISVVSIETGFIFAYLTIAVVVWASANYAVEIIEQSAVGEGWAVFSLDTVATFRSQLGVVLLLEIGVIVGIFTALDAFGGPALAWAFAALAACVGPASVALLGVSREPLRSVHPLQLLRAVLRIGVRYFGVAVLFIAAVALAVLAYRRLGFVEIFAVFYASFWLAYSIGIVVYTRRGVLGVHAPRSPEAKLARDLERLQRVRQRALDHAYGIASRGNLDNALAYIKEYVAAEREPLAARQWMYFEMTRWASPRPALVFGAELAADLDAAGETHAAAKVRLSSTHLEAALRESEHG